MLEEFITLNNVDRLKCIDIDVSLQKDSVLNV